MIKAIFFDLDGTLISPKTGFATPKTQAALETLRQKGILLFAATGRSPYEFTITHMIDDLTFDGIVCLNGQYCYSHNKVIHRCLFDKDDMRQILANTEKENCPCVIVEQNDMYTSMVNDHLLQAQNSIHTPVPRVGDVASAPDRDVLMLMAYIPSGEIEKRVLSGISGNDISMAVQTTKEIQKRIHGNRTDGRAKTTAQVTGNIDCASVRIPIGSQTSHGVVGNGSEGVEQFKEEVNCHSNGQLYTVSNIKASEH